MRTGYSIKDRDDGDNGGDDGDDDDDDDDDHDDDDDDDDDGFTKSLQTVLLFVARTRRRHPSFDRK